MTCKSKFASAFGIVSLLAASVAPAAMYAANMKLMYVQSNSALASGNAALGAPVSGRAGAIAAVEARLAKLGNVAMTFHMDVDFVPTPAVLATASNTLGISGNVGPAGAVSPGTNVTGSIQANEGFTASGAGVANSTSTFSMAGSTSVDSASTGLTISEAGTVDASNGGEGQELG